MIITRQGVERILDLDYMEVAYYGKISIGAGRDQFI